MSYLLNISYVAISLAQMFGMLGNTLVVHSICKPINYLLQTRTVFFHLGRT